MLKVTQTQSIRHSGLFFRKQNALALKCISIENRDGKGDVKNSAGEGRVSRPGVTQRQNLTVVLRAWWFYITRTTHKKIAIYNVF